MNDSDSTTWAKSALRNLQNCLSVSIILVLIFRLVSEVNSYQDAATLIQASNSLERRINPYENEFFLNGFILAIPARLYSAVFPDLTGARLYVVFNMALICLLIWDIVGKHGSRKILLATILVLASSPMRAMAASVQHTGVIIGCSYFAFRIASNWETRSKFQILAKYASVTLLLLVPMELKPQLVLPLIVLFIFQSKLRRYAVACFVLALSGHIVVSLYFQLPLDKYWLNRLISRSSETAGIGSRENSPWALMGGIFGHPEIWLGLSSVLFVLLIIGLVGATRHKSTTNTHFLLAFTIPLTLTYIHPYDLILPVIAIARVFVLQPSGRGPVFMICFFLLPTLNFHGPTFIFSILLISYSWLNSRFLFSRWVADLSEIACALLCYGMLNYLVSDLWLKINIHFSILILGFLFLVFKWQMNSTVENECSRSLV